MIATGIATALLECLTSFLHLLVLTVYTYAY